MTKLERIAKRLPEIVDARRALIIPAGYEDFTIPVLRFDHSSLTPGEFAVIQGCVSSGGRVANNARPPRFSTAISDTSGNVVDLTWFGEIDEPRERLKQGQRYTLFGEVTQWNGQLQMAGAEILDEQWVGRWRPIYQPLGNTHCAIIRDHIHKTLSEDLVVAAALIQERLQPADLQAVLGNLPPNDIQRVLTEVLQCMHTPASLEDGRKAVSLMQRIGIMMQARRILKDAFTDERSTNPLNIQPEMVAKALAAFSFELTGSQLRSVNEIVQDLNSSSKPMKRALCADVGYGKTATYAVAAAAAVMAGKRVIVMLPSRVLAEQVFKELQNWYPQLDKNLVIGSEKSKGYLVFPLLVGTTALIHRIERDDLRPDLIIVDEQQRFAREQRDKLLKVDAHILEVTATCIPRSQCLIQMGVTKLSTIDECHVEKNIVTRVHREANKAALFQEVKQTIARGGQVLCVYPSKGIHTEADDDSLPSVLEAFPLWEKVFPGRVAMAHGSQSEEEQRDNLRRVRDKEVDILLATTVIETGVHLPDARRIIINRAERFGLSTLHQLRGRVGRTGGTAHCDLLVPDDIRPKTATRLSSLELTNDGFVIAELDLEMRGPGELEADGNAQSGFFDNPLPGMQLDLKRLGAAVEFLRQRDATMNNLHKESADNVRTAQ